MVMENEVPELLQLGFLLWPFLLIGLVNLLFGPKKTKKGDSA